MATIISIGKYLLTASLIVVLTACASSSLLSPYPSQMQKVLVKFKAGAPEKAQAILDKRQKSADASLYMLEKGRLAQISGDYATSLAAFDAVIEYQKAVEAEARISATRVAAGGASLVSNDNAIPYRLPSYERTLLHQMQAVNYLALGKAESALVEIRRAEQVQREAEDKHTELLREAHLEADKKKFNLDNGLNQLQARYASLAENGRTILSSYQNAYVHYVSGLLYEMTGELDDAFIDYRRAYDIVPSNQQVLADLVRLARLTGRKAEHENFSALLAQPDVAVAEDTRELIVLFEQRLVTPRQEARVDIATYQGWLSVALPIYHGYETENSLQLRFQGKLLGETGILMDTNQLARRNLQAQMPLMLARQVVRVMAKQNMRQKAASEFGPGLGIITMVWNTISEQADRRSWLSLPANGQVVRVNVPNEAEFVDISVASTSLGARIPLVKNAAQQLIQVIELGQKLYIRPLFPRQENRQKEPQVKVQNEQKI